MSKFCDFEIFFDIFHKIKENLGQEHVKRQLLLSQCKIGTVAADFPGKMTVFFQFRPYFSTCHSLKSGFLTYTKIIFLECTIIGLFSSFIMLSLRL